LAAKYATVTKIQEKPTKKWKPLPLTTVEFQKAASRLLSINSQQAMSIAESLYNKGFISYPRTETDRFDRGMDLKALCLKQIQDPRWGPFADNLVNHSGFHQPREGRNDDKAHPPIHPVTHVSASVLNPNEAKVYEYITRRFLACCSEDATGRTTTVTLSYGSEEFSATGLVVLERNYLNVYPYENWHSSEMLPKFTMGERFEPGEAMMHEGKTSPPNYLTEADLIALMDANGIGTDATMAEHITKIQEREYVITVSRGGNGNHPANNDPPTRGRGRGSARRVRGGVRGGGVTANNNPTAGSGNQLFIPTNLGMALVDGYDKMEFDPSLHKPFLRKEMERRMKDVCEGKSTKEAMVQACVRQYKAVFEQSEERLDVLKAVSFDSYNPHTGWCFTCTFVFSFACYTLRLTIFKQSCRRYVLNAGR
jgi:DNA topoisomerase-3